MSAYTDSYARRMESLEAVSTGPIHDCHDCLSDFDYDDQDDFAAAIETGDVVDEGGFGKNQCDSCGTRVHGNRYTAHGIIRAESSPVADCDVRRGKAWPEHDVIVHLSVCEDCLCYIANGAEPETWEG